MKPRAHRNGTVLILALWALLLLAAAVFGWVKFIDQEIAMQHEANAGLEATANAHSGAWIAMHPLVTRQTPLLEAQFDVDHGYKVKLEGEGGKLNLTWLLSGLEQDPRKKEIFDNYLRSRGLSFEERAVLIDCL